MTTTAQYDVFVIGSRLAGLTSAARAAQLGLSVLVLERGEKERYPCNSRYSGGLLHLAFHNVTEPVDSLIRVIDEATHGHAKPELARAFAGNCARAVDWLREEGANSSRSATLRTSSMCSRHHGRLRRGSTGAGAVRT